MSWQKEDIWHTVTMASKKQSENPSFPENRKEVTATRQETQVQSQFSMHLSNSQGSEVYSYDIWAMHPNNWLLKCFIPSNYLLQVNAFLKKKKTNNTLYVQKEEMIKGEIITVHDDRKKRSNREIQWLKVMSSSWVLTHSWSRAHHEEPRIRRSTTGPFYWVLTKK